MRVVPLLASILLGAAALPAPGIAAAQVNYDQDRARIDAEIANQQAQQQQQAEMARQAALAAQRDADAARARANTENTLQNLDNQRRYPATAAPPPATARSRAALDARQRADAARLDALTDRLLADSNARIRAIKPASSH